MSNSHFHSADWDLISSLNAGSPPDSPSNGLQAPGAPLPSPAGPSGGPSQADLELWLTAEFGLLDGLADLEEPETCEDTETQAVEEPSQTTRTASSFSLRSSSLCRNVPSGPDRASETQQQNPPAWMYQTAHQQISLQRALADSFGLPQQQEQQPNPLTLSQQQQLMMPPVASSSSASTHGLSSHLPARSSFEESSEFEPLPESVLNPTLASHTNPLSTRSQSLATANPLSPTTSSSSSQSTGALNPNKRRPILDEEEKRRRNTEASARFRLKKKLKEQELRSTVHEMADKIAKLEDRNRDLEQQVSWLKGLLMEKHTLGGQGSQLSQVSLNILY